MKTELVFILDRSGSMAGLESDTIGGFNAMVEKQKREPGEALVTTVLFDSTWEILHDRLPLEKVPPMTAKDYSVGGCTALLDAVGGTVRHIARIHKYARREDVPDRTLVVITTDGRENASRTYTYDRVQKLIRHEQEKYGWEFLFLGANIDAAREAARFGIRSDCAADYHADSIGTEAVYESVCEAVCQVRRSAPLAAGWKRKIDADFKGRRR